MDDVVSTKNVVFEGILGIYDNPTGCKFSKGLGTEVKPLQKIPNSEILEDFM